MKKKENVEKKQNNSDKLSKKMSFQNNALHFSKKNNKIFNINDLEHNCILYSDMNIDNSDLRNDIKRTTIMPCLPTNDININILKFNRIKIRSIKEADINSWKAILYNHNRIFSITQLNENNYINDDNIIFNNSYQGGIMKEFDEMDIITKDAIRTRSLETKLIKDYIKNLETLLRFFVKKNKIQYKQGLNEIAGAFLLLKYSNIKNNMTFSEIFNLLNGFFHLFVFNYYYDKTIYALKNSLCLVQLLLKYHSPDIFNTFEKAMLFPEVYATSWLLTVFSYKLNLNKLFYLWNKLILENDQLMIHYFMAALLIYKKNLFVNLDEYSLPFALNRLNISSEKEIDIIYNNALNLRKQTPYSFRIFAYKLDILKHKSNQHKLKYDFYHPDTLISIPIFPSETCFICYKKNIKCPDEYHIITKTFNCEHCSMGIKKENNYSIIDLRINESNNNKNGILQNVVLIDQKELKDENSLNILKNKFEIHKDKTHFIFINSQSGILIDSESNFNTTNMKPKRSNTRIGEDIEINQKKKKLSQKEKNYSKEEDLLKKLVLFLVENNYKYISYAYGGFEAIHNQLIENKNNAYSHIKILNHNEEKCDICKKNIKLAKEKLKQSVETSTNKFTKFLKNSMKAINPINKNEIIINNNEYKSLTIDEVNKMISSTNYFAGPCSFVLGNKKEKENNESQGLIIIYNKKLYCIKGPTHENKQMQIIEEIILTKIKENKIEKILYCYIYFINDKNKEDKIIIKFNSEIDLEKFIISFKKAKSEL